MYPCFSNSAFGLAIYDISYDLSTFISQSIPSLHKSSKQFSANFTADRTTTKIWSANAIKVKMVYS